jgi:uncharacterized protein
MAWLTRRSGWLTLLSAVLAAVATCTVALALALKLSPIALGATLVLCVVFWIGSLVFLGVFVYGSGSSPGELRAFATYRLMVAAFLFATIVSNLISTGYMALTGKLEGLAQGQLTLSPDVLVIAVLSLQACLISFLYLRLVRTGALGWAEMGFTWTRIGRQIAIGLPLGLGMLTLLALTSLGLRAIGIEQTQASLFRGLKDAPLASFVAFFFVSAIIAPFVEEAYFRGYVFRACSQAKGRWQAYAMSAGLFALAHVNLPALLPFVLFGLVSAYVVQRTRTIGPSVVAHAVNNGAAVVALYVSASSI